MPNRTLRRAEGRWLALAGLVVLAACARTPAPARTADTDDYFPMVAGASWVYELRAGYRHLAVEVTGRGEMNLPKHPGAAFVMEETNHGPRLGFVETSPVAYLVQGEYLARVVSVDYAQSGGLRVLGEDPPTLFLPLHPQPGHRWSQRTSVFDTPEGGGAQLGWSFEVKPRTSVTVPAGHFDDVIEIESSYLDLAGSDVLPEARYHDYYARGVGLVRSVTEDPSGDPENRVEQVLLEYHFPVSR